jgi:predicted RNA-binding Zn-ribbon protein involved in translation (DUF1610 family)
MYSRWLSNMERTASHRPFVGGSCARNVARGARERSFVCTECGVDVRGRQRRRELEDR